MVVGLVTKAKAPCERPWCRSSSSGQHLHRDVAGGRVLLQMIQDRPAEHVGQQDIERDGGGVELAREGEGFGAAHGDQDLEALVAREIAENARIVQVIFDDQQDGVAWLKIVAVVLDRLVRSFPAERTRPDA